MPWGYTFLNLPDRPQTGQTAVYIGVYISECLELRLFDTVLRLFDTVLALFGTVLALFGTPLVP